VGSASVPTIGDEKVGTAQRRLCPPYEVREIKTPPTGQGRFDIWLEEEA